MPHPSLFASANIGSISNCVFNLVQSAPSDPSASALQNTKNWTILGVEIFLMLFSFAVIKWIHSFDADPEQSSHFLRFAFHIPAFENTRDENGSYFQNVLSLFVTENLCELELL